MIINKFSGLNLNINSFSDNTSVGTFEIAENVVVNRTDVVEKRKGFENYILSPGTTPKALVAYKSALMLLGSSYINKINQTVGGEYSSQTSLTGQTISLTYPRYAQAGANLYVATDNFITKLENTSASLLKAGVPKAPDCTFLALGSGTTYSATTGIHEPDTQIGYRVLFGRKDVNSNLVLGAPSEFATAQNSLLNSSSVSISTYDIIVTYNSHGLVTNDFVTIRQSNGSNPVPDGEYVVTAYTSNDFTISTTATLSSAPVGVTSLKFGIRRKPKIEFTIPSNVDTTDFIYRVYRTSASISNDVEPDLSTLQLVHETNLTSANLSTGYIQFTDEIDDLFRGAYLYTNPNTGEGESEANFPPPVGRDIAAFKEHLFIAYPTTNYTLDLNLIRSSASTFVNNDYIDVIQTERVRTATSSLWQSGTTVRIVVSSTSNIAVNSYVLLTGFANSENVGKFLVSAVGIGYIEVTIAARINSSKDETGVTASVYPLRRYKAAASESFDTAAGGDFALSTGSSSVAVNIDSTARSIVKTINRDPNSTIYASYVSTSQSLPGQMYLYGITVVNSFSVQVNSATVSSNFDPAIPSTSTDLTKAGTNVSLPNGIFISKIGEYEAFPLTSYLTVGSQTAEILRIIPLKNSLIVIKPDGVFRVSGSSRSDFSVYPIDNTVKGVIADACIELNGVVYAQTDEGVARITETDVSLISSEIDEALKAVYTNSDFLTSTTYSAVPDQKHLLVSTISPSGANISYCYNYITGAWTSWTKSIVQGVVFDDNKFYAIDSDAKIVRQRKNNTKLDYCDESDSTAVVVSVGSDSLTAYINSTYVVNEGDIFVFNSLINRVTAVSAGQITFAKAVNFVATDTVTHYKRIVSTLVTSPFSGDESQLKRFTEFSAQFRNRACKYIDIGFVSDAYETDYAEWISRAATISWGEAPWGLFPWGGTEASVLNLYSGQSQPLRVYIPKDVQYSTWLKLKLQHNQAAEEILLQSIGFRVAKISNRTSR